MAYPGPIDRKAAKQRRQIAERLLRQGLPVTLVAQQLGLSSSTVYTLRQQLSQGQRQTDTR
jgi:transposase-like protein